MSSSPSLQQRLERLTPDQRQLVAHVVSSLEQAAAPVSGQPRRPGGLLGAMHTHDDFDTPLAEEFLLP